MNTNFNTDQISPVVDLGYAQYRGNTLTSGVDQYLGMRYAEPPVGNLRFRAPAPPVFQTELQDALAFQPISLATGANYQSSNESEDCLFVNVWTPTSATAESNFPVWVYIQGGGYQFNANANYNGSGVVVASDHSIVFVNFNYRVGCWGFLASEKVREDGDLNVGLLDQRAALQWVQKHISKFGGNPNHVVAHGVSAGAGSLAFHLAAYGGRNDNLFVGAILESPFLPTHPPVSGLGWQFDAFVNKAECADSIDMMSALRSKPTSILQEANVPFPCPNRSTPPRFPWTVTVDGDFVQNNPYRMFDQGKFIKVPLMIGNDTDEGTGFVPNATSPEDVSGFFLDNFPNLTPENIEAIHKHYPIMPPLPLHESYFPSAAAAYGDAIFTSPGNSLSSNIASHVSTDKLWNYRYNVRDQRLVDMGLGVPHTFETPAIFGPENVGDDLESSYRTYNHDIVPVVMKYWISFVRSLDPNVHKHTEAPTWESWGEGSGKRLLIETNNSRMEDVPRDEIEKAVFWRSLGDVMQH